jgi:flagellar FliL protein
MSDAPEDGEAEAAPKPKGNPLLPVLLMVNLAGTGLVAVKVMKPPPPPKVEPTPEEKAKLENHPTATVDPFVVNLNEKGPTRYLKANFEFELANDKAAEELGKDKLAIRDELLRYLSGLTVEETMGEDGKDKIQKELIARVDKELGGGKVRRCFFTEFVIQ